MDLVDALSSNTTAKSVKGNKPITIGHQYALAAILPERDKAKVGTWVVPMAVERVKTEANKELVGARQVRALLTDEHLPYGEHLCVEVNDSSYSKPSFLNFNRDQKNLVTIVRVRGSRTFYRQPEAETRKRNAKGHPTWYGRRLCRQEPETWEKPDETLATTYASLKKTTYRIEIQCWNHLLMRGKRAFPCTPIFSGSSKSAGMTRRENRCSQNRSG